MLLSYTRQVGLAMICLKIKGYVHRDLAARNVLMSADGSYCKVRTMYQYCGNDVHDLKKINKGNHIKVIMMKGKGHVRRGSLHVLLPVAVSVNHRRRNQGLRGL